MTWLSLDHRDNNPASFWTYLIAALQTAEPHIGASAISLRQSPQPPPVGVIVLSLIPVLAGSARVTALMGSPEIRRDSLLRPSL